MIDKKDIIFISIPKNATVSIHKALGLGTKYNHMPASTIKQRMKPEEWNKKFVFSFVRNPYDRLVSWFFHHKLKEKHKLYINMSFKEWILKGCPHHWNQGAPTKEPLLQHKFIFDENNMNLTDFIGRFENMKVDFPKLCSELGTGRIRPAKENVSKRNRDYKTYYDGATIKIVSKIMEKDLDLFKYTY